MNSYKMRNKLIIGFIIIVIVISGIIIFKINIDKKLKNTFNIQEVMERIQEINKDEYYWGGIVFELLREKRDWSKLPLSKKFLKKYHEEKGFFNNSNYYATIETPTEIDFVAFDKLWDFEAQYDTVSIATGNGEERIAYKLHYIINDRYELDDIEVLETAPITRPDGSLVMYDKHLTLKNDYERIIEKLLYPTYVDLFAEGPFYNEVLPLSDNFKKKYPKYNTDGITNELGFNYAKYYPNYVEYHQSYEEAKKFKKDEDKNIFYGYTVFDDKMNIYKLSFILDKDNNIDDCIVELYKTEIGDFSDIFKDW